MLLSFGISNVLLALADGGETPWWNYPGFELWKFVNLGIFVLAMAYLLTRKWKIGEAFKTRRENIRRR